jgi:hypothetical protein
LFALALCIADDASALTQDLTSHFEISRSGLRLNRTTNTFDSSITLRNASNAPVLAPIDVVVGGLPSGITLANKAGDKPDGRPYVSPVAAGSMLQAGGTLTFTLKFANPARVTFSSTLQVLYTVAEAQPGAPVLLGAAATGQSSASLVGRVEGMANRDIVLQAASSRTCVLGTLVNGASVGGSLAVRTDGAGYFAVTVPAVNSGDFVDLKLTSPATTASSMCLVASRDNDSWPKAFLLDGSPATVTDLIDAPGKARWYKFAVTPGQRIDIRLSGLAADYDLAAFKDIGQAFASHTVTVSPASGPSVTVTSTILVGTQASSTASAQINVPDGLSSVQATANYAVPLALVESLTRFAGETVKSLKLTSVLNGGAGKTLAVTASGRELEVPPALLSQVALLTP